MDPAIIESLECTLGETQRHYRDAVNFQAVLDENNYPDRPEMFGWGHYHQTAGDIFDLGIASARKTLVSSAVAAKDIDLVYFCSTCFPGDEIEHIGFNARVLGELGLSNAFPVGITLNNCTSFLGAISAASSAVRAGDCRNVLLITADKVYDEGTRFDNFALLSDASASCIVTSRANRGYEVLAHSLRASDRPITTNRGKNDSELYKRTLEGLIAASGIATGDVKKVLCSNIFKPITQLKETQLGFRRDQLFLDNVSAHGHCFSADTVINLIDCAAMGAISDGDLVMLSADAPNLRASVLLRRRG